MEKLKAVLAFLSGKKTIATGILMVALGLLQGNNEMTLEGFGLIFLRMGIK